MYEIFEKLLHERGITTYRVAKETGIPTSSFSDWKKKRSKPKFDNLKKIADFFDVSIEYLMGETTDKITKPLTPKHMVQMALYSEICCGSGCFVDDNIIDYISLPDSILNPNKDYFAQYAKGDSMINANINDGDLLIFEKTNVLDNGKIGCFCIDNNDAMCKKYYKNDQGFITLQPANDKYPPVIVTVENTCFRIIGKLVGVYNIR